MGATSIAATYIIGVIITFSLCKILRGDANNKKEDIDATYFFAILSWAGFIVLIILGAYYLITRPKE